MINRQEAIGIFLSIVVMAAILAYIRFGSIVGAPEPKQEARNDEAVLVTSGEEEDLRTALLDSFGSGEVLTRLVIDDVLIGTGDREVAVGDTVVVDYIGSTQDGIQFDSSYERGQHFVFTVGEKKVIEGWEEGLVGMRAGGQRILVIPPSLGYGDRQVGPIAPNTTLVFAIELLEIR